MTKFKLPKGILFDFDGVIVNSRSTHYAAWTSAFKELFQAEIPDFPEHLEGSNPQRIAAFFADQIGEKERYMELHDLKLEHLVSKKQDNILLPGVHELIQFLKEKSIPHGIASNASRNFVKHTIEQQGLDIEVFTGNEDYKHPKPHPEAYITLARYLGFSEKDYQELWIMEDSFMGLKAALDSGMYPVGIGTRHAEEALEEHGAKCSFKDLAEVFSWIKKL